MQADEIKPSLTDEVLRNIIAAIPANKGSPAEELLHNDPYICAVLLKYYGRQSCKV